MFQVIMNSNVSYIPPNFLAFHIPLIFALQQTKISEICTLFQPIRLQVFCILTINGNTPGYRSTVKYKNYMNISRTEHQFCPPKKNKCQGLFCGKKSLSFGGNIQFMLTVWNILFLGQNINAIHPIVHSSKRITQKMFHCMVRVFFIYMIFTCQ